MANQSTSPDRPELRWVTPAAYVGAGLAFSGMGWFLWSCTVDELWPMVLIMGFIFGLLAIYILNWLRVVRGRDPARMEGATSTRPCGR